MNKAAASSSGHMRTRDMTQGHPLRLILAFSIPLLIGNLFQQVYNIVDTMVAGYCIGDQAIAAIGATTSLYHLLLNAAIGLNNGYGIVLTRCFGAKRLQDMRQGIAGMLLLNIAASTLLTFASLFFLRPLLHFLNIPDAIFDQTLTYISIICLGIAPTVIYNMCAAILRAVGNSTTPLYFLILSCVLNIVLDLFFVVTLHMGIAGTAAATVIAQTVSALLCALQVFRCYGAFLPRRTDFRISANLLSDLVSTGLSMALMVCVVDMGTVIFQRANNLLGEIIIAAHTSTRRVMSVFMAPFMSIATACATFIGQNRGAQKYDRIRSTLKKTLLLETGWAAFSAVVIFLLGAQIVRLTTGTQSDAIISNAVMALRIHFAFYPVLGVLLCLRMAMQALGMKLAPVLSSCIELCMKILSARLLIPRLGYLGTSITEPVTWVVMLLFLCAAFACRCRRVFPTT